MRFSWKPFLILSTVISLVACSGGGSSSSDLDGNKQKSLLDSGPVSIVFPLGHSVTTLDTMKVKGTITPGVSELSINGVSADFSQSDQFWYADVPVAAEGNTSFSLVYENDDAKFEVDTMVTVERQSMYLQYIGDNNTVEFGETLYVDMSSLDQIWAMGIDGSNIRLLWDYGDASFEGMTSFNMEDGLAVSADGASLYLVANTYDAIAEVNNDFIINLDTSTGDPSILFGPSSVNYQDFSSELMAFIPSSGTAGQLIFGKESETPNVFDIETATMAPLNIAGVNDLSGGLTSTKIYNLSKKSDGVLRLIGRAGSSFWSSELDLTSCDQASCTISNEVSGSTFSGCASPLDDSELHYGFYHQASERWVFSTTDELDQLCAMNITDHSLAPITLSLDNPDDISRHAFTQSQILVELKRYQIESAELGAVLDNTTIDLSDFNAIPEVGNATTLLNTAREVVVNNTRGEVYWLDRDLGVIHKLDLATWQWSKLLELGPEIIPDRGVSTRPEFQPEESVLDEKNGMLYIVSDGRKSVFSVDVESGDYEVVVQHEEAGENPFDLNYLQAISLNKELGILYLANERDYDATQVDTTRFNVLAYNIADGNLIEVSAPVLLADSPEQERVSADYEMVYDSIYQRVLYYSNSPFDGIIAADINNGDRSIISFDHKSYWSEEDCLDRVNAELCARTDLIGQPSLSNARGQTMDESNNRLLVTSQFSDDILAMDLGSGVVSVVSPTTFEYGPVFNGPKGIDMIDGTGVAVVSDESLDALFLVDTDSGHRVLLQKR